MATFLPKVRDGRSWADRVQVLHANAAEPIFNQLPGWAVSCSTALGAQLVSLAAVVLRRAVRMSRDLNDDPHRRRGHSCDRSPFFD